jgi:hypothetical protein
MKPQFQHKLATSYLLWFENFFMKHSEAYSIKTGSFLHYVDDRLPVVYESFGSQYKQIVYDSSLPNIYIPSGLYISGNFTPFEKDKYMFDFDNGRFIGSGISSDSEVTGQFTVKDINFYYTNDTEENIVLNVQEKINQSVSNIHTQYYQPYEQKIPAIYLSNDSMKNSPFALGGMNETKTKARATIIANNSYELDTVLSIFADSYNEHIPLVDFESHPFNEYSSLKTGYYSYEDLKSTYAKPIFVKEVYTSKLSDKLKQNLLKDLYIGFVDFDLSVYRYRF